MGEGPKNIESDTLPLKDGQSLLLRVFVDKSMIEAFRQLRYADGPFYVGVRKEMSQPSDSTVGNIFR